MSEQRGSDLPKAKQPAGQGRGRTLSHYTFKPHGTDQPVLLPGCPGCRVLERRGRQTNAGPSAARPRVTSMVCVHKSRETDSCDFITLITAASAAKCFVSLLFVEQVTKNDLKDCILCLSELGHRLGSAPRGAGSVHACVPRGPVVAQAATGARVRPLVCRACTVTSLTHSCAYTTLFCCSDLRPHDVLQKRPFKPRLCISQ